MFHFASSGSWEVFGACVSGRKVGNARDTRPALVDCEDVASVGVLSDGLALVLADGAGGASLGGLGAKTAVKAALAQIADEMCVAGSDCLERVVYSAYSSARTSLETLLEEMKSSQPSLEIGDFSTTLLILVARGDSIAVGQIGDGIIVYAGSKNKQITKPSKGNFFNETCFLTSPRYRENLEVISPNVVLDSCIVMCTDGLESISCRIWKENVAPHPGFFLPFFSLGEANVCLEDKARQVERFLQSERVDSRVYDDRSLFLIRKLSD